MADYMPPYSPHRDFIAPAWARTELWRIGMMIIAFEFAFWIGPVVVASMLPTSEAVIAYYDGVTALATLGQFATFGITAGIFLFILRRVHHRGFWSLIGAPAQALVDIWRVGLGVGAILLLMELIPPWIAFADGVEMCNPIVWLLMLPFALIVLLIQVGTEEIYFRGYLQQQFACLSSSPFVWMMIPSLLFGISHYGNGDGIADGVLWMVWATVLGMAAADLTARTGTLGAAIGMHLANNIFALVIVGVQGWPSSGLALFNLPPIDPSTFDTSPSALATPAAVLELVLMCLTVLIMWLAARIALRR